MCQSAYSCAYRPETTFKACCSGTLVLAAALVHQLGRGSGSIALFHCAGGFARCGCGGRRSRSSGVAEERRRERSPAICPPVCASRWQRGCSPAAGVLIVSRFASNFPFLIARGCAVVGLSSCQAAHTRLSQGEFTPLHVAAWNGHAEAVTILLASGADATLLSKVRLRPPAAIAKSLCPSAYPGLPAPRSGPPLDLRSPFHSQLTEAPCTEQSHML